MAAAWDVNCGCGCGCGQLVQQIINAYITCSFVECQFWEQGKCWSQPFSLCAKTRPLERSSSKLTRQLASQSYTSSDSQGTLLNITCSWWKPPLLLEQLLSWPLEFSWYVCADVTVGCEGDTNRPRCGIFFLSIIVIYLQALCNFWAIFENYGNFFSQLIYIPASLCWRH